MTRIQSPAGNTRAETYHRWEHCLRCPWSYDAKNFSDMDRDFFTMGFEREMASVEQMCFGVWQVTLVRRCTLRGEDKVVFAPHNQGRRLPPEIAAELADHVTDYALSDREINVLRRVATGNSNKFIASQLNVSEATIKGHMKSILSKLGANDRTHAVTIAIKRGFIDC